MKHNLDKKILDLDGEPVIAKGKQFRLKAPTTVLDREGKEQEIDVGVAVDEELTYRSAIKQILLSKKENEENKAEVIDIAFKLIPDGAIELDSTEVGEIVKQAKKFGAPIVYGRIKRFFDKNEGVIEEAKKDSGESGKKKNKK